MWNNHYDLADKALAAKKDAHPRFAIEYAMLQAVRNLMSMNNEGREKLLDVFQAADNLAYSLRSKPHMFDADDAVHPNLYGHRLYADAILSAVLP
jgi:hypothetical protein